MERLRGWGQELLLFWMGGVAYFCLELLWRGRSHWTMILVGGACFLLVGRCGARLEKGTSLLWRALAGAALITAVEFVSGCVLNLWLGLGVWDYSALPGNVLGQVCLPYTALWALLVPPLLWVEAYLRRQLQGGGQPSHRRFRHLST